MSNFVMQTQDPKVIFKTNGEIPDENERLLIENEDKIEKTEEFVPPKEQQPWHIKYKNAFSILIPWGRTSKTGNELPLQTSGCFNYFSSGWITGIMVKAYKSGLGYADLFRLPAPDQSKESASRLQRLWQEEQENAKKSEKDPNLMKVCFKFCQTRIILATLFFMISAVMQFLAPSLVLKMILDYISDPDRDTSEGWQLLALLAGILLVRMLFFGVNFNVGLQTSIRLCGATMYLGFSKLLRLANLNEDALGQLVTCFTGDQERVFDAVVICVLFFGKFFRIRLDKSL